MIRNITVGIDVGTHTTRVVVCEFLKGETLPKVIGTGSASSSGLRHGYVVNVEEVSKSVKHAVLEAEKSSGVKIRRALVSIGGITLSSEIGIGNSIATKANNEITELDINKAIAESEESIKNPNRKIIHTIPVLFKLDGKDVLGRVSGLHGTKLEVKTLFITCLQQHLEELVHAISLAGIEVIDVIASPVAASLITLSSKQKNVGVMLVNIGAETVSIAVFENSNLISLQVFPIGGTDITNDIALGLKIPLEEAEGIKIGSMIGDYPKKKLDEIIEARLSDIFELIENHLKKIKRSGLLPAGIVITGGGGNFVIIEDLSKSMLKLPSKIGNADILGTKNKIKDSSWFVALGLAIYGRDDANKNRENGSFSNTLRNIKNEFRNIAKQLLP